MPWIFTDPEKEHRYSAYAQWHQKTPCALRAAREVSRNILMASVGTMYRLTITAFKVKHAVQKVFPLLSVPVPS